VALLGAIWRSIWAPFAWVGRTWSNFWADPLGAWRADVHVIGEVAKKAPEPRVDVYVTALQGGVLLTLAGYDVTGSRLIQVGGHIGSKGELDTVVNSLLEARGKVWPS
jgi:hypothetical protein